MIEFIDVGLRHGQRQLLADFNWRLPDPGAYLLVGASGSGKTLLGRMAAGRLRPQRGRVLLDGAPLYGGAGRRRDALLFSAAEQLPRYAESVQDYLVAELAGGGVSARQAGELWPLLEEQTPGLRRRRLDQLSHGEVLSLDAGLALCLPARVAVLDGHLSYLDHLGWRLIGELLQHVTPAHEKFILLTANRLVRRLPQALGVFALAGGLPVRLAEQTAQAAVSYAAHSPRQTVIIRGTPRLEGYSEVTSGASYTIVDYLEDGLQVRIGASLDAAIAELARQGMEVQSIEWLSADA